MTDISVLGIKLINFTYDFDYEAVEGAEIRYVVEILHRSYGEAKNLTILVTIKYFAADDSKPVLQAACLTSFRVPDAEIGVDSTGHNTVTFQEPVLKRLTQEAVSHARALVAVHIAATPFSSLHINITEVMSVAERDREKANAQINKQ